VDVPTAAAAFGISRSHAYELIIRDEFPAKVIRVGNRYRVITASVIRAPSDGT
jgi:predicted DNA-binding transcriptional regulator AlpA